MPHLHHHGHGHTEQHDGEAPPGYRRVSWIALLANAIMVAVELLGGLRSGSVSLLADAIDFFGDAGSYAVTLAVLGSAPVWRTRTAILKAACMAAFGVFVLGRAAWVAWLGGTPDAATMGFIGALALCANVGVAALLFAYRTGDANMRSVWLCSRNDAISNVAVMAAALGVLGTHSAWPDLAVAAVMGILALSSSVQVLRHAQAELAAQAQKPQE